MPPKPHIRELLYFWTTEGERQHIYIQKKREYACSSMVRFEKSTMYPQLDE